MFDLTLAEVKRDWKKPPNLVSLSRLALVVPVCLLVLQPDAAGWIGFGLFVLAASTDKIDGWLAKRNNGQWTTKFGKVLDSYIDKILILATLLTALSRVEDSLKTVTLIVTVAVLLREIVVGWIKTKQPVKSAVEAGRFSMVAQSTAVSLLVLPALVAWQTELTNGALCFALGASLCSGWVYWAEWLRFRKT